MRTTDDNIRQLLEMLDHPETYTEQEIRDIINYDEDTRATYHLMVEAKCSSRLRQREQPVNVDAAWQRLIISERLKVKSEEGLARQPEGESQFATAHLAVQPHSSLQKIAASVIGVLLISGISFAAIHMARQQQKAETTQVSDTMAAAHPKLPAVTPRPSGDTIAVQPVTYNNIPLEKMLQEIAAHYDVKVRFLNEEARGLRFRFVWNPQQGIDQVVSDLNQFERLTVTLKDNVVTVE